MIFHAYTYFLKFRHAFGLSHSVREGTEAVCLTIEQNGCMGYGEIALPPYLATKVDDVLQCLVQYIKSVQKSESLPHLINQLSDYPYLMLHKPAMAIIDMAMHDLYTKQQNMSLSTYFGGQSIPKALSTFTISVGDIAVLEEKLMAGKAFPYIKLKLGTDNDKAIIHNYKALSRKPFCVDANQGWKNKEQAYEMIQWLADQGAYFVEQPLASNDYEGHAWLKQKSPIPIIADESIATYEDLLNYADAFSGFNIKMVKCGGINQALKMIAYAKDNKKDIMLGCMSESSCGAAAALALTHFAKWVDLDGPFLINNDPFEGYIIKEKHLQVSETKGIGIYPSVHFTHANLVF